MTIGVIFSEVSSQSTPSAIITRFTECAPFKGMNVDYLMHDPVIAVMALHFMQVNAARLDVTAVEYPEDNRVTHVLSRVRTILL